MDLKWFKDNIAELKSKKYTLDGEINIACCLGERAHLLVAEIERLQSQLQRSQDAVNGLNRALLTTNEVNAQQVLHWRRKAEEPYACDGIRFIAEERMRQFHAESFSLEHDAHHTKGELAIAGACYAGLSASHADGRDPSEVPSPFSWPWQKRHWKPSSDPIRNLARAGALIAAEIDRLRRGQSSTE